MKPTQHQKPKYPNQTKEFKRSIKNPEWKWKLRAHQLEQEGQAWMEAWLA